MKPFTDKKNLLRIVTPEFLQRNCQCLKKSIVQKERLPTHLHRHYTATLPLTTVFEKLSPNNLHKRYLKRLWGHIFKFGLQDAHDNFNG